MNSRLKYIDNLRLSVIILVVLQHFAISSSGMGRWYYRESPSLDYFSSVFFGFFESFNQAFFMGILFLIAGYFVPGAYDKKGFCRFITDRLKRLGIPSLLYMLIINPFIMYFQLRCYGTPSVHTFWRYYADYIVSLDFISGSGPLWFCVALLVFTAIYGLIRVIFKNARFYDKANGTPPSFAAKLAVIVVIAAMAFLIRLKMPVGTSYMNMMLCYFAQYIVLFIVGIYSYRTGLFSRLDSGSSRAWLYTALFGGYGIWSAIMLLGGASADYTPFNGGFTWQSAAYCLWESFTAVGISIGLIALFRDKFDKQSELVNTLSDDAFAVYVLHSPIIIAASILAARIHLYPIFKFILLSAVCTPLCFVAAHYLKKVPLLKKII